MTQQKDIYSIKIGAHRLSAKDGKPLTSADMQGFFNQLTTMNMSKSPELTDNDSIVLDTMNAVIMVAIADSNYWRLVQDILASNADDHGELSVTPDNLNPISDEIGQMLIEPDRVSTIMDRLNRRMKNEEIQQVAYR